MLAAGKLEGKRRVVRIVVDSNEHANNGVFKCDAVMGKGHLVDDSTSNLDATSHATPQIRVMRPEDGLFGVLIWRSFRR